MLRTEKNHDVLGTYHGRGAEVSELLDRVEVHDECVGKFRTVIEVEEKLHWLDVTREVSDVHIADLANKASQAILQETFNKVVVMPTN